VRHVWGAELRWNQRLAGLPVADREKLLAAPEHTWSEPFVLDFDWVPPEQRTVSRRKIAVHALLHSQRHWAQLATLVRSAGFPSKFRGDLLFSPAVL
jgi:uncharacterized damage-inducible protein DinB